jgi:hypothetical protein
VPLTLKEMSSMSALLEWSIERTKVRRPLATARQWVTSMCCGIFFSLGFSTTGSDTVSFNFFAARGLVSADEFFMSMNLYFTFFIKNCWVLRAASSLEVKQAA